MVQHGHAIKEVLLLQLILSGHHQVVLFTGIDGNGGGVAHRVARRQLLCVQLLL